MIHFRHSVENEIVVEIEIESEIGKRNTFILGSLHFFKSISKWSLAVNILAAIFAEIGARWTKLVLESVASSYY